MELSPNLQMSTEEIELRLVVRQNQLNRLFTNGGLNVSCTNEEELLVIKEVEAEEG